METLPGSGPVGVATLVLSTCASVHVQMVGGAFRVCRGTSVQTLWTRGGPRPQSRTSQNRWSTHSKQAVRSAAAPARTDPSVEVTPAAVISSRSGIPTKCSRCSQTLLSPGSQFRTQQRPPEHLTAALHLPPDPPVWRISEVRGQRRQCPQEVGSPPLRDAPFESG